MDLFAVGGLPRCLMLTIDPFGMERVGAIHMTLNLAISCFKFSCLTYLLYRCDEEEPKSFLQVANFHIGISKPEKTNSH